jgi:hypothetical protein
LPASVGGELFSTAKLTDSMFAAVMPMANKPAKSNRT